MMVWQGMVLLLLEMLEKEVLLLLLLVIPLAKTTLGLLLTWVIGAKYAPGWTRMMKKRGYLSLKSHVRRSWQLETRRMALKLRRRRMREVRLSFSLPPLPLRILGATMLEMLHHRLCRSIRRITRPRSEL
jgi:hypothetical protein